MVLILHRAFFPFSHVSQVETLSAEHRVKKSGNDMLTTENRQTELVRGCAFHCIERFSEIEFLHWQHAEIPDRQD